MISAVFTIFLGVLAFVMFSFPMFWVYKGEGALVEAYTKLNCYDMLKFGPIENIYYFIGQILLLIAMIFAGIMILLALAHLFGRAAGNPTPKVEVRLVASGFLLFMLLSALMFVLFANQKSGDAVIFNVGYGFLSALGAALLSIFFAPSRRKLSKKEKAKVTVVNNQHLAVQTANASKVTVQTVNPAQKVATSQASVASHPTQATQQAHPTTQTVHSATQPVHNVTTTTVQPAQHQSIVNKPNNIQPK